MFSDSPINFKKRGQKTIPKNSKNQEKKEEHENNKI